MTIRDKRKETERKPTAKQLQRRKRTLELHVKGLTIPQINKALHDEHFETSEHTVFDDVHSQTADEYKEGWSVNNVQTYDGKGRPEGSP